MKIAIISDIHNNEVNLKKVLDYCGKNKIEKIICCGDLASRETLDFLNDNFAGVIYYTFGNADYDDLRELETLKKYRNTFLYKNFGEVEFDENPVKSADKKTRKIAFVHFPREAKALAETGKYDFVFYGHTHKPWLSSVKTSASKTETINNCMMLNPGNAAGEIYPPTFAVWETESGKFELIRVHEIK